MTKVATFLMMGTLAAGCVTASSIGSKPWHTERIATIDVSLEHGEISELQRRELKEEAEKTRDEYRKERRLRYKQAQLSRRRIGYFRRPSFRAFGYRPYYSRREQRQPQTDSPLHLTPNSVPIKPQSAQYVVRL